MNSVLLITMTVFFIAQSTPVLAEDAGVESNLVEVGNKICPVSNAAVGTMGDVVHAEYDGKLYNLCCKMCKRDFERNPEKYSAIAEAGEKFDEGGAVINESAQD